MRVIVATQNAHKVAEIAAILNDPSWILLSFNEFMREFDRDGSLDIQMPSEDATCFEGNARIKARFVHGMTGCAALADDSGLVVDALKGAPGIYSARYAGESASADACNQKLLSALEGVPQKERTARFVCSLVYIDEKGREFTAEGICEGFIATAPRGEQGFGYDPVFVPKALSGIDGINDVEDSGDASALARTLAEYAPDEKNAISHRAKALHKLYEIVSQATLAYHAPSTQSSTDVHTPEESNKEPDEHPVKGSDEVPVTGSDEVPATGSDKTLPPGKRVRIVAFDLDGTLIDAASPVRLVNRLVRDRIMSVRVLTKIGVWGARYKMGSELDQSLPRKYIFGSFTNFLATDANSIMINLYNEDLRRFLRPMALQRIRQHKKAGEIIILVSASFDPIVREACREIEADGYIATQMEVRDGYYTGRTIGAPPEGIQKLIQLTKYANERYGEGNWELTSAYGDHFSDAPLLAAAQHATAVDPDRRLERMARSHGWEIQTWPL